MGSEWVSQISLLWMVSDGTTYRFCFYCQEGSVSSDISERKHQVKATTLGVSLFKLISLANWKGGEITETTALRQGALDVSWSPPTPPHPSFPDPGLTLACHRMAALCVMPLHADFGVEIAGTMWIVLSVFSKIRITMAFAQLTHAHWSSGLSLSLLLWSHQLCLKTFPDTNFTLKNKPMFNQDLWWKKKAAGVLLGGEALVWGWCGELCDNSGLMQCGGAVMASIANFCLKASSLRRLANQL